VLDAEGQVIAHTGYKAGGPEGYIKQLSEFLDVYAQVVKMKHDRDRAEGLDRAKLLDKLVDAQTKLAQLMPRESMQQIEK